MKIIVVQQSPTLYITLEDLKQELTRIAREQGHLDLAHKVIDYSHVNLEPGFTPAIELKIGLNKE